MNKLTLKLDCEIYNEIKSYLLDLNGVDEVLISKDEITVIYNDEGIDVYMLKGEIELFLEIDKTPSIIGFNKYNITDNKYDIYINDLCCEYCLKGFIEELLMIDGIVEAYTDFDYVNKKNVKIMIKYDSSIISMDEINNLEKEFNVLQKKLINKIEVIMICYEIVLLITICMRGWQVLDLIFLGFNAFTYLLFKLTELNKKIISIICIVIGILSFFSLAGLFVLVLSVMLVYHGIKLYRGLSN